MIFLDLSEGLGNQMFQYAFARSVQKRTRDTIYLDTMSYRRNRGKRSFSLMHYKLNSEVAYGESITERVLDYYIKILRKILKFFRWNFNDPSKMKKLEKYGLYFFSDVFGYIEFDYLTKIKNKYIIGSWMNEKYFFDIREELLNDFTLKEKMKEKNLKLIEEIRNCNSVCIHIRLGDYLDPKWSYLNVCTGEYYKKGIDIIKESIDNPQFYIFSNSSKDLQWIKKNYKFLENYNFVDMSNSDYEDLEIMRNCKCFIISNSTYSWWAQYLSVYKNKIVIAPDTWQKINGNVSGYKKNNKTLGIYQKEWKIVPVE